MSRAQSFKKCHECGQIVSLTHRCQQRPQSKMRGETKGLTTGPQWDSARWQAHLSSKQRVIGVDFGMGPDKAVEVTMVGGKVVGHRELGKALEHGGKVLKRDVWERNERQIEVEDVVAEVAECIRGNGVEYHPVDVLLEHFTLISRAQKAERALKVGDKCIARTRDWNGRECEIIRVDVAGKWPFRVRRDDGVIGVVSESELELVRAVEG